MNGHVESKLRGEPAGHGLGPRQAADLGTILERDRSRAKHKQAVRRQRKELKRTGRLAELKKLEELRAPSIESKRLASTGDESTVVRILRRFRGLFSK